MCSTVRKRGTEGICTKRISIGDGIARVYGLNKIQARGMIEFAS